VENISQDEQWTDKKKKENKINTVKRI
jgi:hypothetical protein